MSDEIERLTKKLREAELDLNHFLQYSDKIFIGDIKITEDPSKDLIRKDMDDGFNGPRAVVYYKLPSSVDNLVQQTIAYTPPMCIGWGIDDFKKDMVKTIGRRLQERRNLSQNNLDREKGNTLTYSKKECGGVVMMSDEIDLARQDDDYDQHHDLVSGVKFGPRWRVYAKSIGDFINIHPNSFVVDEHVLIEVLEE